MRLLTYNIHKGIGGRDRLYRLRRIIEVIENENPDLLCLQEVDRGVPRSRLHDQPKLLSEQFFSAGCTFQLNVRLKKVDMAICFSLDGLSPSGIVFLWGYREKKREGHKLELLILRKDLFDLSICIWDLGSKRGINRWATC